MGDLAASVDYLLAGLSMPNAEAGDALPHPGDEVPPSRGGGGPGDTAAPRPTSPITLPGNECDHYRMSLEHLLSGISWLSTTVRGEERGQLLPALLQRAAHIYYRLAETHLEAKARAPGKSLRCIMLSSFFQTLSHEEEAPARGEATGFPTEQQQATGEDAASQAEDDPVSMALAVRGAATQGEGRGVGASPHLLELAGDAYFFIGQEYAQAARQDAAAAREALATHQADVVALEAVDAELLDLLRGLGKGHTGGSEWMASVVTPVNAGADPDPGVLRGSEPQGWHSLQLRWRLGEEAAALYEQALRIYERRAEVQAPSKRQCHHSHA